MHATGTTALGPARLRLTRFGFQGLVFYVVMFGAFFASPYSNLFFLLLGFLTLLGISGIHSTRRHLRGVGASLGKLEPVSSETRLEIPLRLEAPRPARFGLEAHLELENGQSLSGRVDLLEGHATLSLQAPALPRGCHAVRSARLETTHPIGLLRATRRLEAPDELVVYPSPRGQFEGRSAEQALDELLGRGDPGTGDLQPVSLRDHREGEGMRGVHWRASARRARLVVQEWEGGSGQGLEVVLDRRCTGDELEQALATLSAMVELARTNKETLRIHSQGLCETFGDGQRPWSEALRFLARADRIPEGGPAPPPTSPRVARLPRASDRAK